MSLLDTASLIVTPNGYKEGKLYSVIPSDGSGDLSVTRATTATRVNSQGLVELVPYNLLSWSEDFSSTRGFFANVVGSSTAVFTANYATAPNGTTTADRIQLALNGQPYADWVQPQSLPLVTGNTYTYSIYLKSLSGSATLMIFNDGVGNITKTITTEWQRYDYTWTATTGSVFPRFLLQAGTSLSADLVAWGYQINEGTIKDYQKTETRLNIPRLDYSNGTCPSILVEPQRTNLALWSEQFDNSSWTKSNSSISANSIISPSGIQDADKFIENNGTGDKWLFFSPSITAGTSYTYSVYAKKGERDFIYIYAYSAGINITWFDLNNGSVGTSTGGTASIENVGNGWYRCTYTITTVSGLQFYILGVSNADNVQSYTGDGTSGVYIWGAQLEAGSYATSYIPTTSASVTRNADVISKTGISSLIGQTEGTLFFDFYVDNLSSQTNNPVIFSFNTNNNIQIFDDGRVQYYDGSGNIIIDLPSYGLTNGRHKFAIAYNTNDVAFYIDGALAGTDTSCTPSAKSSLYLGYTNLSFLPKLDYNAAALWKTRLTNTQLAQLTTI